MSTIIEAWEIGDDHIPVSRVVQTQERLRKEIEWHDLGDHREASDDWCPRCDDDSAYLNTAIEEVEEQVYGDLGPFNSETLILDTAFIDYARDCWVASNDDILRWPYDCIDWEKAAQRRKVEFLEIRFGDRTYFVRG